MQTSHLFIYFFSLFVVNEIVKEELVISQYVLHPFDYRFDFGTTNLAVGNLARVGSAVAYTVVAENSGATATPLILPPDVWGEVAGLEIFPGIAGGQFEHIDYAKLIIGGKSFDDQIFNEMTAPGLVQGLPDSLGASGLRIGAVPINFGVPMLLGGNPMDCCPKIPPGKPVEIEIAAPTTAEGGLALTQAMTVRLWIAKVSGVQNLKDKLAFHSQYSGLGYYTNGTMNCSFDLGDLEVNDKMPIRTKMAGNPIKNMVPEQGAFDPYDHWEKLPGGLGQDKPTARVFSMFTKLMTATTANESFEFTSENQHCQDAAARLSWNFDKGDALKITHIGVKQDPIGIMRQLWLKRSGREAEQVYEIQNAKCPFLMPRLRDPANICYMGPTKLLKPYIVWNEQGQMMVKDNATSVAPWSATNTDGFGIYTRGIRYELNKEGI